MSERSFRCCVLFGGMGFIGTHFAAYLLSSGRVEQVWLADSQLSAPTTWPKDLQEHQKDGRVQCLALDVRQPISHPDLPQESDLVVNLAAVHREPGHEPYEYFGTNLPGADHVCAWAEKVRCPRLIF